MIVWLNGALLAAEAARIDPADRGFTLGDGVFETIRAGAGGPRRLDQHLGRLRAGAGVLGIAVGWTDHAITDAIVAVLAGCALTEAALRITLSRGPSRRGVLPPMAPEPTLLIAATPLPPASQPARLVICRGTRRNEHSPLSRIKSLNYLDGVLARMEAASRGADDALLLNTAGWIAESSVANLFVQIDGAWMTPPVTDGALPGIARAALLTLTRAHERRLELADLARCSAALLTNSLSMRPVAAIEGGPCDVDAAGRFAAFDA